MPCHVQHSECALRPRLELGVRAVQTHGYDHPWNSKMRFQTALHLHIWQLRSRLENTLAYMHPSMRSCYEKISMAGRIREGLHNTLIWPLASLDCYSLKSFYSKISKGELVAARWNVLYNLYITIAVIDSTALFWISAVLLWTIRRPEGRGVERCQ